MMKVIDNNFEIYDEEFERKDSSIEKWFIIKNARITQYGVTSYIRQFRVQKVLNHNLHLN